ncbi:hypothetical protein NE612_09180 [Oscillibacter valericigenes]|nr:hypothetical protein [Oscillibacter valericigenes]
MIDLPEMAPKVRLIPTAEKVHRFMDLMAEEDNHYKALCLGDLHWMPQG